MRRDDGTRWSFLGAALGSELPRPAGWRCRSLATAVGPVLLAASVMACAAEQGPAAGAPEPEAGERGQLAPPEQPDVPLLELSYEGGMIANPDPTPFVRVYPGGRVVVHYPAYMKRAGDYELRLSDEELEELLAEFQTTDVLTLETNEIEALTAEVRASDEPLELPEDHGVEAVVRIRAESFTPQGADRPTLREIDTTLRADAQALRVAPQAGVERLRGLASGVERLESLAEREDLRRIEP